MQQSLERKNECIKTFINVISPSITFNKFSFASNKLPVNDFINNLSTLRFICAHTLYKHTLNLINLFNSRYIKIVYFNKQHKTKKLISAFFCLLAASTLHKTFATHCVFCLYLLEICIWNSALYSARLCFRKLWFEKLIFLFVCCLFRLVFCQTLIKFCSTGISVKIQFLQIVKCYDGPSFSWIALVLLH